MCIKRLQKEDWSFWAWWMVANFLSFSLGIGLSQFAYGAVGEIVSFLAFGVVVGFGQWLILRKVFQISGWWIVATGLGSTLGLAVTNVIQRSLVGVNPYIVAGSIGMTALGLVIGITQWWILRRNLARAGWWIFFNTASWFVGGSVVWAIGLRLSEFIKIIVDFAVLGIIVSGFTGLAFVFKWKGLPSLNDSQSSHPLQKGSFVLILLIPIILASIHEFQVNASVDLTPPPDISAISTCNDLPLRDCDEDDSTCDDLVLFEPATGPGYIDYPVIGETWDDQYRSYLRRDLQRLIKYAAARVSCETAQWDYVQIEPVGLGDMSEADGAIPGTSTGHPDHPPGTHLNGNDIDIAYFQIDFLGIRKSLEDDLNEFGGNLIRPICKFSRYGMDVYHCTEPPLLLDPWRTALFIAYVAENPYTRVIGVDGQIGPLLDDALDQLVQQGRISNELRDQIPLVYEPVNEGMGWFRFHHHHLHISMYLR